MSRTEKRKQKKYNLWIPAMLIAAVILLLTSVAYSFYNPVFLFKPSSFIITSDLPEDQAKKEKKISENNTIDDDSAGESLAGYDKEQINIVLLGFDRTDSKTKEQSIFRPDSIIIAALNFRTAEVSLISIPRDSYVEISGSTRYDKINHAYMHGYIRAEADEGSHQNGLETTLKTIQDLLGGIPLHEYVILDIDGAADVIDTIGGLHYEVEFDVRARLGKGELLLNKGYQHLDGKKFMDYVRDRASHHGGERGRMERQQQILIALFEKLKQEGRLSNVPNLYRSVDQAIETELNLAQVASLAAFALRVNPAEIKTYILDGRGQLSYRGGQNIWYWVIDEEKRVDIIREVFGVSVEKRTAVNLPGPYYPEPEEEPEEEAEEEFDQDQLEEADKEINDEEKS